MKFRPTRTAIATSGKTLLEIMVVIGVLAILAAITVSGLNYYKRKAQDLACMSNLRGLHAGFASYLNENNQIWPQNPMFGKEPSEETDEADSSAEAKFWYEALKPYGPHRHTWLCPCDRQGTAKDTDEQTFDSSYIPTNFDEERGTAYKWKNMPWLIERGGFHGKGEVNEIMPDAQIRKREQ